ncbi:hypothetical protein DRN97_04405 [Methanosarcinales archaeon]|nr:MAG: hypothetical protein DRN97_04405 [Methanosarcinales archaeon]
MIEVVGEPKLENSGKVVKVTVRVDGSIERTFNAKPEHVMDDKMFARLMRTWERIIREDAARSNLDEKEIEAALKKRKGAKLETGVIQQNV